MNTVPPHAQIDNTLSLRHCSKCHNDWPATSDYWYARGSKWRSPCRQCHKNHYIEHKEIYHQKQQQYRVTHREELNQKQQCYYAAHKEAIRQYKRHYQQAEHLGKIYQYRITHREERRQQDRQYWAMHREEKRQQDRQYRATHREATRLQSHVKRARKRNAPGTHTIRQIQEQYTRQKGKCYYCQSKTQWGQHHIEHVVPLSRGGSNDISNIVIACPACNLHKHNKLPYEWPEGGRLL